MILSRRFSLGGKQLDEIDEAVVIRNVDTGVSHESVSAVNRMGGYGQRMTSQHWESLEVSVTFAINVNKRELERRREIFDAVKRKELFPKKCFSIGSARERRYYLECRKIR